MLVKLLYCEFFDKVQEMIDLLLFRSPDYGKGIKAAEKIFELLNRKPMIDNGSTDGDEIVSAHNEYF